MHPKYVAVFACDVADFSTLIQRDEPGTLERLSELRRKITDPLITTCHGQIFNTAGDSIIAGFPSPVLALHCAIRIQRESKLLNTRLRQQNAERFGVPMLLRIGINWGTVSPGFAAPDHLGDTINIAARLESVADAGGICVSDVVYKEANGKLPVNFEDLNVLKIKEQHVHTYRVKFEEESSIAGRRKFLVLLSYLFLRLDQIPGAGWSRGLALWMDEIWRGDPGLIYRNPNMRQRGGTDITCHALNTYLGLFSSHGAMDVDFRLRQQLSRNLVAHNAIQRLSGGAAPTLSRAGQMLDPDIRHSLLSLATILQYGELLQHNVSDAACRLAEYLRATLSDRWAEDTSFPLGLYAAACELSRVLSVEDSVRQLDRLLRDELLDKLNRLRPLMRNALSTRATFDLRPPRRGIDAPQFPFKPYFGFWRMERYGFLSSLTLVLQSKLPDAFEGFFGRRCADFLMEMLGEIDHLDTANARATMISFHRRSNHDRPPKTDWGITAELGALLSNESIDMLTAFTPYGRDDMRRYHSLLDMSLLDSFDQYHNEPSYFRFTQGVSFSRYLATAPTDAIHPEDLLALDERITTTLNSNQSASERTVSELVQFILELSRPTIAPENTRAIEDLIIDKIEPGENVNDAGGNGWAFLDMDKPRNYINRTLAGYGSNYIQRYGKMSYNFIDRLPAATGIDFSKTGLSVLDLGCGTGRDSLLFQQRGFDITLVDLSEPMLHEAKSALGLQERIQPRNVYDIYRDFSGRSFDVVFANSILIHVPPPLLPELFTDIFALVKPGGAFFCNFKIGDHSLISRDGRYFAYYRDHALVSSLIADAGFEICEIILRSNTRNLYGDKRNIRWANFYCTRPQADG